MNTAAKIGAYAAGLAVVFGATFGLGHAVGEVGADRQKPEHAQHNKPAGQEPGTIPAGLQVSEKGYTLTPRTTVIKPGEATDFQFSVTGPDGRPVTGFQVEHEKRLHFIVVSRDLGGFQHLHPTMAGDGLWTVKLTLDTPGVYRAFADFTPTGGSALTLGTDLAVAGDYTPRTPPTASRTAEVDGYTVTLAGDLVPGKSSRLTLKVSKDGRPVTDLQPYLGAYGHLVALRSGDLAYLHVHPDGEPGDGKTKPGPEIVFYAEVPSRGDYRLFLDFQHEGKVRTADFTMTTGATAAQPTKAPAPTPSTSESGGHDDDHTH